MARHLLAKPNRYADSFRSRRFDKLDCSSWKASFKHRAPATHPHSLPLSPSLFPFHLLLPLHPLSHFLHSISLLACGNLESFASKDWKGLFAHNKKPWKEQGRKKFHSTKFLPHHSIIKMVEVLKIWNDALVTGDRQMITVVIIAGIVEDDRKERKKRHEKKKREDKVERRLGL